MRENEEGFVIPEIDSSKCINCGLCNKKCIINSKNDSSRAIQCYASRNKNTLDAKRSTSGGIFYALAKSFINKGGLVCGAVMNIENNNIVVKHIISNNEVDLMKMQGSKYVQSDISEALIKCKEMIDKGKKVLFCGTPCQNAAIRAKVGNNEGLYLIDLICHGVPSQKMFNDYIKHTLKNKDVLVEYVFRDKTFKNGYISRKTVLRNNIKKVKYKPSHLDSFYHLFLRSYNHRKGCYTCKFAKPERVSDITIGDFWGIEKVYTDISNKENAWSCILVNTSKGKEIIDKYGDNLILKDAKFSDIASSNMQLNCSSNCPKERKEIMDIYSSKGYKYVEKYFKKKIGKVKYYGLSIRFRMLKK